MKATIKRVEGGVLLVSDQPLLEKLGVDSDGEVELSMNGDVLTVTPIRDAESERLFERSAAKILQKHAGLFERLSK